MPSELVDLINKERGDRAAAYVPRVDDIARAVIRDAVDQDIVLVMSNGSFGDLPRKIVGGLQQRES